MRTMSTSLGFRIATKEDTPRIAEILTDCAQYVKNLGVQSGWPVPFSEEQVTETIEEKEIFVVEKENQIVATFRLIWSDPMFWGTQPPIAGYLHKLEVSRAFAHQGIGRKILTWVEDLVSQEGRRYVRLDCIASNAYIVNYYKDEGFHPVKILSLNIDGNILTVQLMEKAVTFGGRNKARM